MSQRPSQVPARTSSMGNVVNSMSTPSARAIRRATWMSKPAGSPDSANEDQGAASGATFTRRTPDSTTRASASPVSGGADGGGDVNGMADAEGIGLGLATGTGDGDGV